VASAWRPASRPGHRKRDQQTASRIIPAAHGAKRQHAGSIAAPASPPHELPYEWQVGWRYTRAGRAGRRNGFISFISGVSMLGIALGVAALIIVLSVMNGFQKEVRDRMLSVIAHIEVHDLPAARCPTGRPRPPRRAATRGDGAAPFVHAQALLARRRGDARRHRARHRPGREGQVTDLAAQLRDGAAGAACSRAPGTSCWAANWRGSWARASATR
jgi:hypothetical protein